MKPKPITFKALREARGMSQKDLAKAAGVSLSDVRRLEAKTHSDNVALAMLRDYAEVLGGQLVVEGVSGDLRFVLDVFPDPKRRKR